MAAVTRTRTIRESGLEVRSTRDRVLLREFLERDRLFAAYALCDLDEREFARLIAEFLQEHDQVERVFYPGLPTHPQHDLARRQMSGFGGMISFEVKGGLPAARRMVERTRLFTLAESLGGVEALIELPAAMTHASIPAEIRRAHGVADGLVRISVGIEDVADLISDLDRALSEA